MAAKAQKNTESLSTEKCAFRHSENRKYSDNLFDGGRMVLTALDGSKLWYKEKDNYTYSNSNFNHYTQMIWQSTTEVGAAIEQCANGDYIIVANYSPCGNVLGSYPY